MLTLNKNNIPLIKAFVLLSLCLFVFSTGYAQEQVLSNSASSESASGNLSQLHKQARMYRAQGYKLQSVGDYDSAANLYKKAVELDPLYAVAYNDLGVVWESKGSIAQAEEYYLRAVHIDPALLGAYSNLGFLYEAKRDLKKAQYYWNQRVMLGQRDDPWTAKAKQRLRDITLVLDGPAKAGQDEALDMMREISTRKALLKDNEKELAQDYFEKAKQNYKKDNYAAALQLAVNAMQLDPANSEIEAFIEKVQLRALSR